MKKFIILIIIACAVWYFFIHKTTIKNAGQPISVIVAFGDSLTAGEGGGNPVQNSYPAVLAQLTGKTVINAGYAEETALNAPKYIDKVLSYKPQMVLIEFGSSDFLQRINVDQSVASIAQIVDAVQAAGAIAVIVDTGGRGMGVYTKAYKKLARQKQAVFVPGILNKIFNKREYMSNMLLPNFRGYKIVAEQVHLGIDPYLDHN